MLACYLWPNNVLLHAFVGERIDIPDRASTIIHFILLCIRTEMENVLDRRIYCFQSNSCDNKAKEQKLIEVGANETKTAIFFIA